MYVIDKDISVKFTVMECFVRVHVHGSPYDRSLATHAIHIHVCSSGMHIELLCLDDN